MKLKVAQLDEQIDKLRETDRDLIQPKSKIGNKKAKVEAILKALETCDGLGDGLEAQCGEHDVHTEGVEMTDPTCEEDMDMDIDSYED